MELSLDDARRIAVRAQLLDSPRPDDLLEVVRQLTFVQLEPTAYVAPTADLVLWSRLGSSYRPEHLTRELEVDNSLFELNLFARPMEDLALYRAQMEGPPMYEQTRIWLDDNDEFRQDVLDLLEVEGPMTAQEIPDTSIVAWKSSGWNQNRNVMMMLEILMGRGQVAVAGRRGRDRLWDLAERVYHADIRTVPLEEAKRERDRRRLRAFGIMPAKTTDLPVETTRVNGAGEEATIEGVRGTWRVDPDALGRPFEGRTAILSPFDGLIRDRKRMLDLFGFDYALEMYKPKAKRRWGYYALPILHGAELVGKVDAQSDFERGELRVDGVHEDVPFSAAIRAGLQAELEDLARWLRIELVEISPL